MSSTYLGGLADELLAALGAGLAEATTGRAPPSTTFVSHGVPIRLAGCCDDGYATVYLDPNEGVSHNADLDPYGSHQAHDQDCVIIPFTCWALEWGRCVPTVSEDGWPSSADLDLSAQDLLEDLWAVLNELYDRRASGALGDSCGDVRIGNAVPLEPQAGCAGWIVRVYIVADDSGPTGS